MSNDKQQLIEEDDDNVIVEKTKKTELGESSQSSTTPITSEKADTLPQYIAAVTATLSAFAAGTVLAWTSPISSELEHGQYHNITINKDQMGWIGSFTTLGGMLMCVPFGIICDLIGRRAALLLLIIPFSAGWSLIVWAQSLLMLYVGRFLTGMASGACCVAAPMYTTEIAQKEIRGTLGSYFQLMVTLGILFAYFVGKFMAPTHYTVVCAIIPFIFFILFVFQPESPLYSLKKGKVETARATLIRLRGAHYNIDAEIDSLKSMLESGTRINTSICDSLKKRSAVKAMIIALMLMFFQQLCGINAVIFYTGDIFTESGAKIEPHTATILVGAFQALATFISSLIVDKLGRRILLITSDFAMAIATLFLGLFFTLKERHLVSTETVNMLGFLPVVSLCMFVLMFSIGLGPIPWTISGEIFNPELKSFAAATAGTFNWFLAFLVTRFYLGLADVVGNDSMFYAFSLISFGGALFCYLVVPETKGKSVEQIQIELER